MDSHLQFWRETFVLRHLKRPLTVSEPCTGLGAFRRITALASSTGKMVNCCDVETRYANYYYRSSFDVPQCPMHVACGKMGDITQVQMQDVEDAEVFISGPPCRPWTVAGPRLGLQDPLADVFQRVLDMIVELAGRGCLVVFLVENSSEIVKGTFLPSVIAELNVLIPHFLVDVVTVDLMDLWPMSRHRCYLRGMRRDAVVGRIPPPINSFGQVSGASFYVPHDSIPLAHLLKAATLPPPVVSC